MAGTAVYPHGCGIMTPGDAWHLINVEALRPVLLLRARSNYSKLNANTDRILTALEELARLHRPVGLPVVLEGSHEPCEPMYVTGGRTMNTDVAAERLGVTPKQVRCLLRDGQLSGLRSGRGWWVIESDSVDELIEHRRKRKAS